MKNLIEPTLAKNLNTSTFDKVHLNCDCIEGSTVNSLGQPFSNTFAFSELPGFQIFVNQKRNNI